MFLLYLTQYLILIILLALKSNSVDVLPFIICINFMHNKVNIDMNIFYLVTQIKYRYIFIIF